jgi:hypothetical protein
LVDPCAYAPGVRLLHHARLTWAASTDISTNAAARGVKAGRAELPDVLRRLTGVSDQSVPRRP